MDVLWCTRRNSLLNDYIFSATLRTSYYSVVLFYKYAWCALIAPVLQSENMLSSVLIIQILVRIFVFWWFCGSFSVPFTTVKLVVWLHSVPPVVFLILQSEFTEQHRPKGHICANITFQWKLPVSYSGPLWWIELQSGAADCVLICSTCSLWRLLEKAARPIKQTWRAGAG